jgi:hypothetical protein
LSHIGSRGFSKAFIDNVLGPGITLEFMNATLADWYAPGKLIKKIPPLICTIEG